MAKLILTTVKLVDIDSVQAKLNYKLFQNENLITETVIGSVVSQKGKCTPPLPRDVV